MSALATKPSVEDVWSWLADVPDPEIPAVSVVDLGIVRDVEWRGDTLVITVTPTYSGCPATSFISRAIDLAIRAHGVDDIKLETRISPAWTTDWISEAGREKLREYGIAPPVGGAASCAGMLKVPPVVACPRCGSTNTERVSQFGSTPCKASYRCKSCLEPFDYFKSF